MSMSILQVIEHAGYDLTTLEDAEWILSQQSQFEELIEKAQVMVEAEEEWESKESERRYKERFGE